MSYWKMLTEEEKEGHRTFGRNRINKLKDSRKIQERIIMLLYLENTLTRQQIINRLTPNFNEQIIRKVITCMKQCDLIIPFFDTIKITNDKYSLSNDKIVQLNGLLKRMILL